MKITIVTAIANPIAEHCQPYPSSPPELNEKKEKEKKKESLIWLHNAACFPE